MTEFTYMDDDTIDDLQDHALDIAFSHPSACECIHCEIITGTVQEQINREE